jgi:hypothetical protein
MPTSKNDPVDARVRLAIARWPDDAPRGAVTTFCVEHDISRKTFYAIRARAQAEGQAAALEPRSRRPKSSPTRISEEIKAQALGVRAALESSGLDHGPVSVHDKMLALGMDPVPSIASFSADLPGEGRRASGAEEEATFGVAPVRLPGPERVLADRRHRVRADRRPHLCDLPAHR